MAKGVKWYYLPFSTIGLYEINLGDDRRVDVEVEEVRC